MAHTAYRSRERFVDSRAPTRKEPGIDLGLIFQGSTKVQTQQHILHNRNPLNSSQSCSENLLLPDAVDYSNPET